MTLTLDLSADLEQRLFDEASRQGIAPDQFVVEVLKQHLPSNDRREQFAALLKSWREEDQEEQKETFEYLVRTLDEDRPAQRKLFPPALKGISW